MCCNFDNPVESVETSNIFANLKRVKKEAFVNEKRSMVPKENQQ